MKLLTGLKLITAFGLAAFVWLALGTGGHGVMAANNQNQSSSSSNANKAVAYSYVAQPGDSYTLMARKAIQTYGAKYKVNVSQPGIIFAETNMTIGAGSPALNEGQHVSINESTVKSWVDKAKNLTQAEQDAWAVYVPLVNFDTSHVGQAS